MNPGVDVAAVAGMEADGVAAAYAMVLVLAAADVA